MKNSKYMVTWDFIYQEDHLMLLLKKYRRFYRNETGYSITLRKWEIKYVSLLLDNKLLPAVNNDIINLTLTLERYFNIPIKEAIIIATKVWKIHKAKIKSYMANWFDFGTSYQRIKVLPMKKALKEQLARGFIPIGQFKSLDRDLPYIRSNIDKLVYPKQWPNKLPSNLGGIYDKLGRIGVSGYTGITLPKKINGK